MDSECNRFSRLNLSTRSYEATAEQQVLSTISGEEGPEPESISRSIRVVGYRIAPSPFLVSYPGSPSVLIDKKNSELLHAANLSSDEISGTTTIAHPLLCSKGTARSKKHSVAETQTISKTWRNPITCCNLCNLSCHKATVIIIVCLFVVLLIIAMSALIGIEAYLTTHKLKNATIVYDNDTVLVDTATRYWYKSVKISCANERLQINIYADLCNHFSILQNREDGTLSIYNVTSHNTNKVLGSPMYLLPESTISIEFTVTSISNEDSIVGFYIFDIVNYESFLNGTATENDALLFQRIDTRLNYSNVLLFEVAYTSYYFIAMSTESPLTFDFKYTLHYKYFSVGMAVPNCILTPYSSNDDQCFVSLLNADFDLEICIFVHSTLISNVTDGLKLGRSRTIVTTDHKPDYLNPVSANLVAAIVTLSVTLGIFLITTSIIKCIMYRKIHSYVRISD